jgi:hypothetical protein
MDRDPTPIRPEEGLDLPPPELSLLMPRLSMSNSPAVAVLLSASNPADYNLTVSIDVDLNADGAFDGASEAGHAAGAVLAGMASHFTLEDLPSGTVLVRARAEDHAGNTITSETGVMLVAPTETTQALRFEQNVGQASPTADFLARGRD